MAAPPIPPRPAGYGGQHAQGPDAPPPVPPLPPNFAYDPVFDASLPHWEDPLVAPRPFRYDPGIPHDMAQQLENRVASPFPDPYGGSGGFAPPRTMPTPVPPHAQAYAPPPAHGFLQSPPLPPSIPLHTAGQFLSPQPQQQQPNPDNYIPGGFHIKRDSGNLTLPLPSANGFPGGGGGGFAGGSHFAQPNAAPSPGSSAFRPPPTPALPTASQFAPPAAPAPSQFAPAPSPTAGGAGAPPVLEMARPTTQSLTDSAPAPETDVDTQVAWAKEVLALVERTHAASPAKGSVIVDAALNALVEKAIRMILTAAAAGHARALHLRGTLASSGSFPTFVPRNPKDAFRDFDAAARGGCAQAWFNIARDYEAVGDLPRAIQALERGAQLNVESCYYRLGMARLLGQLGLGQDASAALALLHRAAQLATPDVPQPAYVLALILLGEFASYTAPPEALAPFLPRGSSAQSEARRWLERAAYLGSGAAQFKLGHAYEFGVAPFAPDALLSVQYYSLAAQHGQPEADMALSKWFLCGSEGAFDKDEGLARVFAEKAAARGEREGEFAMGYYCEVGIGPKDLDAARTWYTRASEKGSAEARKRLDALNAAQPAALGRSEHEQLKENTLVRRRTQARDEAWKAGRKAQAGAGLPVGAAAPHMGSIAEEMKKAHVAPAPASSGQAQATISSVGPLNPQRRPAQQQQQQQQQQPLHPHAHAHPEQKRYSLSDPGTSPIMGGPSTPVVGSSTLAGSPGTRLTPLPQHQPQHHQQQNIHGGRVRVPINLDDPSPSPSSAPHPIDVSVSAPPPAPGRATPTRLDSPSRPARLGSPQVPSPSRLPPAQQNTPAAPTPAAAAAAPPPKKGPATFQEMGFHSQKLDDRECVIM